MGLMIWTAIRQAAVDFWEEILLLVVFNVIWVIGVMLIIPGPFVTFALFAIVYDVGQGKGISLGKFFRYGWQALKPAYIWGGINFVALIMLVVNINFYASIDASWALWLHAIFIGLVLFWGILQWISLPIYPRLEQPGFKSASRNALVIISRYPLFILTLVAWIAIIGILSSFLQILFILIDVSLVALLTNRLVEAAVRRELQRNAEQ
jgi:uncharacterized membrane protein YesL